MPLDGRWLHFPRRLESLSDTDCPSEVAGRQTHSNENDPIPMIEVMSFMTWLRKIPAKWNRYTRMRFLK